MQPMINKVFLFLLTAGLHAGCGTGPAEQPAAPAHQQQGASAHEVDQDHGPGEHGQQAPTTLELTAEQYRYAGIELGTPQPRVLNKVIAVNGLLDVPPQNLVSISTPMGGFIRKTDLLQGMRVKKGQVLATLENPEFITLQQDYLESSSRLEYLELEYSRQKQLAAENVSAAKTLQQTTAEYKSIRARVGALKEKLALAGIGTKRLAGGNYTRTVSIRSPINGYVTRVNTNLGKFVNPTDVLFTIVDTEHLHVELTVFEKDLTQLRPGQKIRYSLPNETSTLRTATLYLIGREISEERTVRVHAHMDKEDNQLIPGMYVKAFIELSDERVPSLPQEAIIQWEGRDYAFLYGGKRTEGEETMNDFRLIPVEKGVTQNGFTQITLPEGNAQAQWVVQGAYNLLAKLKNSEGEGHGH